MERVVEAAGLPRVAERVVEAGAASAWLLWLGLMGNAVRWSREQLDDWAKKRLARHDSKIAAQSVANLARASSAMAVEYADKPRPKRSLIYPLVLLCEAHKLPVPVPEHEFHPGRRWRFDYAWPTEKVAVEIDGGVWTQGRHTRGEGFIEDQRKMNAAVKLGWRLLHYTPDRLGEAITDLQTVLR